ncbi:hypothetical protein BpHYR1_033528 [Brachionus plicatilis]|uniref:Uncharacterized protein n=1 Tax=Brachionus plicatilis TaxID=10195 RepID=A0A3M7SG10_BRAPC|nr:hypothetical protein BpHYR1_033528 [Brachionus plicatilis]
MDIDQNQNDKLCNSLKQSNLCIQTQLDSTHIELGGLQKSYEDFLNSKIESLSSQNDKLVFQKQNEIDSLKQSNISIQTQLDSTRIELCIFI